MKRLEKFLGMGLCVFLLLAPPMAAAGAAAPLRLAGGLSSPVGMAFDSKGNLYIANWSAGRIDIWRAGKGLNSYLTGIPSPSGLAVDKEDRLYVATYSGGEILRFNADRKKEVFLSGLSVVAGLYFDRHGNLLVAERGKSRVLSVSPQGKAEVLVDKGLSTPVGAIQTGEHAYVIADIDGAVFRYDAATKTLKTLSKDLRSPAVGLVLEPKGKNAVYAVDYGGRGVYRIGLDGDSTTIEPDLKSPVALAMDKKGRLYVGTWSDDGLYRLEP